MKKYLSYIICVLFVLVTIITTVDLCCFDKEFYSIEYKKSNTAERIGVSENDLNTLTDVVLDYLKDRSKTMDIELEVKGNKQEVFSSRAKTHMIDVRELYLNVVAIRNISAVILTVLLIYVVFKKKLSFFELFKAYKKVLLIFGLVFVGIGLYAFIDFNSFWTNFHHIFFNNDLWLLEYNDVLVNMVNETFFFDLVLKIVLIIVCFLVMAYFVLRKCSYEG